MNQTKIDLYLAFVIAADRTHLQLLDLPQPALGSTGSCSNFRGPFLSAAHVEGKQLTGRQAVTRQRGSAAHAVAREPFSVEVRPHGRT